jgi:hypothetical protein
VSAEEGRALRHDAALVALLALLPLLAYAPALAEGRLLGPGDGAALHYPLRAEAWAAWRRGELPSWNGAIFSGSPLLSSYRPGALYPPMLVLAALPPFVAFQTLVLGSLSAAGVLVFAYLRQLGAGRASAYVGGMCFSLGPYLVGHLADTATLVAAPLLPLLLIAAESHVRGRSVLLLAASLALLLLAGSPEAARAGAALLAGRLLIAHLFPGRSRPPARRSTAVALVSGLLLASPQLLPTLLAAGEAGRGAAGLAPSGETPLPGLTGLLLRYVSHSPAAGLALAAFPLALSEVPVRVLGAALVLCLGMQYGRGPLSAPGAAALVFDLALAILGGLSLSAQWAARREATGRRLRIYFLFACLAGAAALSVSAATLGPLPQTLAGAVGNLAMALTLYFALAGSPSPNLAHLWLLPLTISFLLQPHGREVWREAPRRAEIFPGTSTRQALDSVLMPRRDHRILTLVRRWPRDEALDLAFANLGAPGGRRTANGYDPLAPVRNREAFEGMGVGGALPGAFFRTEPGRLAMLGVSFVQAPSSALVTAPDAAGLGDTLDVAFDAGETRYFPLPITPATELRLATLMADAVGVADESPVAEIRVHLASGRELPLSLVAGRDTAEWAYDRPDVRSVVAHRLAPVLESWSESGFLAHRYVATLTLPGRYLVDGVGVTRLGGPGRLVLSRLAVLDATTGRGAPASLVSGYLSAARHLRETANTVGVRLFDLPLSPGLAFVVGRLRPLRDDAAVLKVLASPASAGLDPRREAVAVASEAREWKLPEGSRPSHAELVRAQGGHIEVRAEGPGLLVVAEGFDRGWRAEVDGQRAPLLRVNHIAMGVGIGPGVHRVTLRHLPRGFAAGVGLLGVGAFLAGLESLRRRSV